MASRLIGGRDGQWPLAWACGSGERGDSLSVGLREVRGVADGAVLGVHRAVGRPVDLVVDRHVLLVVLELEALGVRHGRREVAGRRLGLEPRKLVLLAAMEVAADEENAGREDRARDGRRVALLAEEEEGGVSAAKQGRLALLEAAHLGPARRLRSRVREQRDPGEEGPAKREDGAEDDGALFGTAARQAVDPAEEDGCRRESEG